MKHRQVFVKVNAHVDARIAGVVSALNKIPMLQTLESCEGTKAEDSWVCFVYGPYWENHWNSKYGIKLLDLLLEFSKELGDSVTALIRLKPGGYFTGELYIRQGTEYLVEKAILNFTERAITNSDLGS